MNDPLTIYCRQCAKPLEPGRHSFCNRRCRQFWRRDQYIRRVREQHGHPPGILGPGDEATATPHPETGADSDR